MKRDPILPGLNARQSPPPKVSRHSRWTVAVLMGGLILLVLVVFLPTIGHEFVYDDYVYLIDNPYVQQGLTFRAIRWSFSEFYVGFWHPLTWLSHLVDIEFFGFTPAGHHLTNILIHSLNTCLLFLVVSTMTGAVRRSAWVAAFFAVHPLHVESVAWIAERKDLLSTFFWFLSFLLYARYSEKGGIGRYLAVVASFALGLAAKPMLVTLPFTLLLLDYWPLRRTDASWAPPGTGRYAGRTPVRLLVEKIPFLLLVPVAGAVAYIAQESYGAVGGGEIFPLWVRFSNAVYSYGAYLLKTVWPSHLAVFYPHPGYGIPLLETVVSGILMVAVTTGVLFLGKKKPYLPVGWFWYVGTLLPVIGLVQLGDMGMANRYTYVPMVGLAIMFSWEAVDLTGRFRLPKWVLPTVAAASIFAAAGVARVTVAHWRDNVTLFLHAAAVTRNNSLAHYNAAAALAVRGETEEAEYHYRQVIAIRPDHVEAMNNLASLLYTEGKTEESLDLFRKALALDPTNSISRYNLASLLSDLGSLDEAALQFREVLRIDPSFSEAWNNLGVVLSRQGKTGEAKETFKRALALDPANETARRNLKNPPPPDPEDVLGH